MFDSRNITSEDEKATQKHHYRGYGIMKKAAKNNSEPHSRAT